ncbi:CIC11C00000005772 [Sungouiella intermedia]|uniref:CIC11C00000005772 n=1 Tax=Sungouiella intermedia TaxID=45354 RepID=A0A1L0BUM8_9ASCO|nr:CIC11C00000005772 [[Candida] intermedia]
MAPSAMGPYQPTPPNMGLEPVGIPPALGADIAPTLVPITKPVPASGDISVLDHPRAMAPPYSVWLLI